MGWDRVIVLANSALDRLVVKGEQNILNQPGVKESGFSLFDQVLQCVNIIDILHLYISTASVWLLHSNQKQNDRN